MRRKENKKKSPQLADNKREKTKEGGMTEEKKFTSRDLLLTLLFGVGAVILVWALVEEARSGVEFYIMLGSVAALLMIGATFIANIRPR